MRVKESRARTAYTRRRGVETGRTASVRIIVPCVVLFADGRAAPTAPTIRGRGDERVRRETTGPAEPRRTNAGKRARNAPRHSPSTGTRPRYGLLRGAPKSRMTRVSASLFDSGRKLRTKHVRSFFSVKLP